jgi:hypothetical protein
VSLSPQQFYDAVGGVEGVKQADLIDLFAYFLIVECEENSVSPKQINQCFEACDLHPPARTAAHLSEGARHKPRSYIKTNDGYRLERARREVLAKLVVQDQTRRSPSIELRRLESKLQAGAQRQFLAETTDCLEIGAYRAAIVMAWILALDHMYAHVFKNYLQIFNTTLANDGDKRIKVKSIIKPADFTEMPESKFIELCRTAKIISNDVRKVLEQKLGTRNSCAHPSGIVVKRSKAEEFIEDLIENVVLKHPT